MIDLTKLTGYKAEMTHEELLALINAEYEGVIKKGQQFDKVASEVATYKKKYEDTLSEAELNAQKQKEAEEKAVEALSNELNELRTKVELSERKAELLALGYDEELANTTAKAYVDKDMAKVFENQKIHIENVKKAERASALGDGGSLPGGKKPDPEDEMIKIIRQSAGLPPKE